MDLILHLSHQVAEVTRDTCDWDAAADNGREVDSTWRGGAAGAMGAVVRCAGRCPTLKAAFGPGQPGQQPASKRCPKGGKKIPEVVKIFATVPTIKYANCLNKPTGILMNFGLPPGVA